MEQYKLEYQREDGKRWFKFKDRRGQEVRFPGVLSFLFSIYNISDDQILSERLKIR